MTSPTSFMMPLRQLLQKRGNGTLELIKPNLPKAYHYIIISLYHAYIVSGMLSDLLL